LTLIEAPREVRRIGYVEIGRLPRRGLDRDEFRESRKFVTIAALNRALFEHKAAFRRNALRAKEVHHIGPLTNRQTSTPDIPLLGFLSTQCFIEARHMRILGQASRRVDPFRDGRQLDQIVGGEIRGLLMCLR
jgi:hypothetical protein